MDPARHDGPLQLVFSGECLDGHDPQAVREAVARTLKLDEARTARLFSGKRVVLRRQVDAATARRHVARFAAMGALLRAEPSQQAQARRAGATRWRLLRWTSIGVVSVLFGVALGLALGPGLNTLWPDDPPRGAAADTAPHPAPVAPAAVDASPEKLPAAVEESPKGMTAEAMREYRHSYLPAPNHKAFAISSKGAHAWIAGAASENNARERAAAGCVKAMRPGDDGCRIVDADGEWVD